MTFIQSRAEARTNVMPRTTRCLAYPVQRDQVVGSLPNEDLLGVISDGDDEMAALGLSRAGLLAVEGLGEGHSDLFSRLFWREGDLHELAVYFHEEIPLLALPRDLKGDAALRDHISNHVVALKKLKDRLWDGQQSYGKDDGDDATLIDLQGQERAVPAVDAPPDHALGVLNINAPRPKLDHDHPCRDQDVYR
jgi:hypothetical protein